MGYKSNLNGCLDALKSAKKDICSTWGTTLVAEYKSRTPVVSGNMRRSETFEILDNNEGIRVGTTPQAEYALYVEEGGPRNHAQHILQNTIFDSAAQLEQIAKSKMSAHMGK